MILVSTYDTDMILQYGIHPKNILLLNIGLTLPVQNAVKQMMKDHPMSSQKCSHISGGFV